jgi:hypothetical protein
MDQQNERKKQIGSNSPERILLINFPYWSPLIPAIGIASLKSFLERYGYHVRTVDAAADKVFLEYYNKYFNQLREIVPPEQLGNFYNIGHDVLRNHMMAHTNYEDENQYNELVKQLIYNTYYCAVTDSHLSALNEILTGLFSHLETFTRGLLEEEKPSVLGLSVSSGNLPAAHYVFRYTRKHYPQIKTVMGGSVFFNHLSVGNPDLEFFLEKTMSYIDKIIIGKGEVLFLKYLRGELPESQRVFTREHIDEEELKSYTFDIPDLSDYKLEDYYYLAASASTSCPYNCSFCNSRTFFGEFKKRDPAQVVREIAKLQEKHGHKAFFMTDALLNPTITDLARELPKANVTAYLDGYFMVDKPSGNIENTVLWRQGGFYRARIGTESGSQKVLDLINKKITPRMIKAALYSLAYAGIKTTTYWVIGHPGETEEDFQATLDLIEESRNDIWQAECNPFTYYYYGQANSTKWADKRFLLYPKEARDMLGSQTWILDCEPSREEIYQRVFRFVRHCNKLGIPNPYTADELYKADERWKKLHKNAVPSLIELKNNTNIIDEGKKTRSLKTLKNHQKEDGDFAF